LFGGARAPNALTSLYGYAIGKLPALTSAMQAGSLSSYPKGLEGWVYLASCAKLCSQL